MKNKNGLLALLGVICIVLVCGVGYTVYRDRMKDQETAGSAQPEDTGVYLTYNGKKYKKNVDIKTVLFMGVDKTAQAEVGEQIGDAGQADSLNLLVLDTETKKADIIQISRDSVVNLDIYNNNNDRVTTTEGQIALQYAFGDGRERSCRLTGERVSELMSGVDIDSYLSVTLDGITAAADAVGGVPITVPADYTEIDPAFSQGAELVLDGQMAEKYVRSRDIEELDSNNDRMERQSHFMEALIRKMQTMNGDEDSYMSLYQTMEPYMTTNMTADELVKLKEYKYSEEMVTLPGEVVLKDGYAQYLVDTEKIKEILVKYFYKSI